MALTGFVDDRVPRDARVPRSPARRLLVGLSALVTILLGLAPAVATAQLNASIAANRTSGLAPLAVRFDATGSDCDGNGTAGQWNQDLEQCLYSWDFGDPLAPAYAYGAAALAGQARSANLANGFLAGHVFENPGIYTVALTLRNPNGQIATRTQTITVSAYSGGTHCFSSSGNFTGCPSGSQQVSQSNFNSALSTCTNAGSRRCLFRRGDSFTRSGETSLPSGPGIIGAFGSATDRPIVTGSGVVITGGADWRIMDLDFNGPAMIGGSHRLFYRTTIRNTGGQPALIWWGTGNANLYFVRSTIEDSATSNGAIAYYVTAENQVVLGSAVVNSGHQPGGHNLRIGDMSRSVFASSDFGPARAGHTFKVTGENAGSAGTRLWILRDNVYRHDSRGFNRVVSMVPQQDDNPGPVSGGMIEANYCTAASTGSIDDHVCMYTVEMQDMVLRNNTVNLTQRFGSAIQVRTGADSWPEANNVSIMNNSAVWQTGSASNGGPMIEVAAGVSNVRVANNLFYSAVSHPGAVVGCSSGCTLNSNNSKVSTNPFSSTTFENAWRFRLASGSAAIAAGLTRPESFFDMLGTIRTGGFDLGAWESSTASPPPPPVLLP